MTATALAAPVAGDLGLSHRVPRRLLAHGERDDALAALTANEHMSPLSPARGDEAESRR